MNILHAQTNKRDQKNIGLAYVDKVHLQNLIMKKKKKWAKNLCETLRSW